MSRYQLTPGVQRLEEYFGRVCASGSFSHAYILELPRGANRRLFAEDLAARIQCEQGTGCGECPSCRAVAGGNHPDIITITHEKENLISVSEIREQLVSDMYIKPYRSRYKIYLVDDADKMNPQAQNAILKTLEEPPIYGMIFLLSANRHAFLPTVLSRCICPETGANREVFWDGITAEQRSCLLQLLHRAPYMTIHEMAQAGAKLRQTGLQPDNWFIGIRAWYRDVLAKKTGIGGRLLYLEEESGTLGETSASITDTALADILEQIELCRQRSLSNVNAELCLEALLLKIKESTQHYDII